MKKIRNVHYGWLVAGFMLLGVDGMAMAQKRLPIGSSTVPQDGSTPAPSGTADASKSGSGASGGFGLGAGDENSDSTVKRNIADIRANMINVERQRALTHDAALLLQMTAELRLKLSNNASGMSNEEILRQIDTIEKLARNVKERMKGAR